MILPKGRETKKITPPANAAGQFGGISIAGTRLRNGMFRQEEKSFKGKSLRRKVSLRSPCKVK